LPMLSQLNAMALTQKSNTLILSRSQSVPTTTLLHCNALWHTSMQRGRKKRREKPAEGWVLCIFSPYALADFDLIPELVGFLRLVGRGTMLGL